MTAKGPVQPIIGAAGFVLDAIWFDAEMNKVTAAVHTHPTGEMPLLHLPPESKAVRQGAGKAAVAQPGRGPLWLTVYSAKSVVAEFMRVERHTVGGICQRVYEELESKNCIVLFASPDSQAGWYDAEITPATGNLQWNMEFCQSNLRHECVTLCQRLLTVFVPI